MDGDDDKRQRNTSCATPAEKDVFGSRDQHHVDEECRRSERTSVTRNEISTLMVALGEGGTGANGASEAQIEWPFDTPRTHAKEQTKSRLGIQDDSTLPSALFEHSPSKELGPSAELAALDEEYTNGASLQGFADVGDSVDCFLDEHSTISILDKDLISLDGHHGEFDRDSHQNRKELPPNLSSFVGARKSDATCGDDIVDMQYDEETMNKNRAPRPSAKMCAEDFSPSTEQLEGKNERESKDLHTFYRHLNTLAKYGMEQYKTNEKFKNWVQNTRRAKKVKDEEGGNTFLSDLMVHQLEECGFKWGEPKGEKNWEKRFQSLKMFAQSTGHCNFPTRPDIGENHEPAVMEWIQKDPRQAKKLGRWVSEQRKNYRHGDLEQSKISRLNDIGFNWELKRTMKDGTGGV